MQLTSVKPGDIVRIDKRGRVFLAEVVEKTAEKGRNGRLKIRPVVKNISYTEATAQEVVEHWRKSGRARK